VSPQHFDHCHDAYWLSVRAQTTVNHIRFVKGPINLRQPERGKLKQINNLQMRLHFRSFFFVFHKIQSKKVQAKTN